MTCLSRFDPQKGCYVLKDTKPLKPANAFEWRRYVHEEQERRGKESLAKLSGTSRTRSVASTKAIERIRQTQPTYGTMHGMSSKTSLMVSLKPKTFTIYSKAQSSTKTKDKS